MSSLESSTSFAIKAEPVESMTINYDSFHHEVMLKEEPDDEFDVLILSETDRSYINLESSNNESVDQHTVQRPSIDLFKKPFDVSISRKKPLGTNSKRRYDLDMVEQSLDLNLNESALHSDIKLEKAGLDHDYCQDDVEEELVNIFMDCSSTSVKEELLSPSEFMKDYSFNYEHSYCLPAGESNNVDRVKFQETVDIISDNSHPEDNKLRFGLDESYSDVNKESKVMKI